MPSAPEERPARVRRPLVRHPDAPCIDESHPARRGGRTGRGCDRRRRRRAATPPSSRATSSSGVDRVRIGRSDAGVAWQKSTRPMPGTSSSTVAGQRSTRASARRRGARCTSAPLAESPPSGSHASRSQLPVRKRTRPLRLEQVEALGRQRPDDEVAARDDHVRAAEPRIREHRLERRQVPVDVVQRGDLHSETHATGLRCPRARARARTHAVERRATRAGERARRRAELSLPDARDDARRAPRSSRFDVRAR